jgi:transposase
MPYPSDVSREQFSIILPLLEEARKKTKPRKHNLYDVFNALLYIVKTGCQWRALPKEYPDYRSVHAYFRIWSRTKREDDKTVLATVLKKIGRDRAYTRWQKALHEHGYC